MKSISYAYWLVVWFGLGFGVAEIIGLRSSRWATLSETWAWVQSSTPVPVAVVASVAVGGVLFWLPIHWLLRAIDRPGFDEVEAIAILLGAVVGLAGTSLQRRKKQQEES